MHTRSLQAFYDILMTSNCNDQNFGTPNEMNSATCQSGGLFLCLLVHIIRKVLFKDDNYELQTSKLSFLNFWFFVHRLHIMDIAYISMLKVNLDYAYISMLNVNFYRT